MRKYIATSILGSICGINLATGLFNFIESQSLANNIREAIYSKEEEITPKISRQ